MKVVICYNLKPRAKEKNLPEDFFCEFDNIETIKAIEKSLSKKHDVFLVEANENAFDEFKKIKPDIVFNIAEGLSGYSREAQIPAMLDMLNIPYTGSDPLTLCITLHKQRTKEILSYYNIPTAKGFVANPKNLPKKLPVPFPLLVKPIQEGSSKGISKNSVVNNYNELKKQVSRIYTLYKQDSLVEELLTGREFTTALIGNGKDLTVLPIVEIKFDELPKDAPKIYGYEAKWVWDRPEKPLKIFECPANINSALKKKIEETAKKTFYALNCKDWARIDLRLDSNGIPRILEVNPLPGILPNPEENSCFPKAARAAGWSYEKLINTVLNVAIKRLNLKSSFLKVNSL